MIGLLGCKLKLVCVCYLLGAFVQSDPHKCHYIVFEINSFKSKAHISLSVRNYFHIVCVLGIDAHDFLNAFSCHFILLN